MDRDWQPLRPIPSRPDPIRERYPRLYQFFGCYFHQDWDLEASDDRGLVNLFLRNEPEEDADEVRRELDDFLAAGVTDGALEESLTKSFGCDYDPARDGLSVREWLERLRTYLVRG